MADSYNLIRLVNPRPKILERTFPLKVRKKFYLNILVKKTIYKVEIFSPTYDRLHRIIRIKKIKKKLNTFCTTIFTVASIFS